MNCKVVLEGYLDYCEGYECFNISIRKSKENCLLGECSTDKCPENDVELLDLLKVLAGKKVRITIEIMT